VYSPDRSALVNFISEEPNDLKAYCGMMANSEGISFGSRSQVGVLVVWERTRILEATSGPLDIVAGTAVSLECAATTDQAFRSSLRIIWTKDGKVLDKVIINILLVDHCYHGLNNYKDSKA
jgi:hypothetical protein